MEGHDLLFLNFDNRKANESGRKPLSLNAEPTASPESVAVLYQFSNDGVYYTVADQFAGPHGD